MAALLVSCVKEEIKNTTPDTVHMTIVAGADDETKTVLGENGQVNWSLSGEKLAVWQNGTYAKSEDGVTTDNGATMKFGVTLPSGTAPYSYYAVYPNMAAYKPGETSGSSASAAKIDLRQAQYPTAQSFGPSSDILVAKPVTGLSERPAELSLQFARMVAIGKMQIKNLNSTENVTRVTFKADGKKIAGRNAMDLTKDITVAEVSGEINPAQDNIALAYNGENIAANGMTAYFTCWPFSMAAGETFTVEVYTPSKYFTRTVTLPSNIEFKQGRAASFGVDFSGIEGVERQHFTYAKLTVTDYVDAGGKNEYALTTVKPNGSDGPIWDCLAYKGTGIQLRDFSAVNDSYIKLPTFKDDIRTVIVTTTTGNRTICLESSAAGITKDISLTSVSGANTFDLTGKGLKTAYLRVSGGALQVSSIEVWAGEDTRTQLAAPSNIAAALLEGSANSIEVVWDAVENAGSYVVTATPATGDAVSETVTEPSHTFTNLAYETEYTISVVAKPENTATHTDSEAGVCADKVTTGSKPAGTIEWINTAFANLNTGDKVVIVRTSGTAYAMTNDNGTTKAPGIAAVSVNGDKLSATPSNNIVWVVGVDGSNKIFYTDESKTNWLYCTATNNGIRVGTNTDNTFTLESGYLKHTKTARFIGVYNNQDWRCYTSSNTNIGGQTFGFFVEQGGAPDTREPLAKPANLTCSAQADNSLTFTWDAVANASGYQVSLDGGSNWEATQTEATYTWEGLSSGTTYTLYVKAIGDGTNFKDSDAVSAEGTTTGTTQEKEYTLTIASGLFNSTSYAANNNDKTTQAVASDGSTLDVTWYSNQVMLQSGVMQWQKNNAYIYNKTDLGTIVSVTVDSSAGTFTTYYGTSQNPTSGTDVQGGFFTVKVGSATGKTSQIVVKFKK